MAVCVCGRACVCMHIRFLIDVLFSYNFFQISQNNRKCHWLSNLSWKTNSTGFLYETLMQLSAPTSRSRHRDVT